MISSNSGIIHITYITDTIKLIFETHQKKNNKIFFSRYKNDKNTQRKAPKKHVKDIKIFLQKNKKWKKNAQERYQSLSEEE